MIGSIVKWGLVAGGAGLLYVLTRSPPDVPFGIPGTDWPGTWTAGDLSKTNTGLPNAPPAWVLARYGADRARWIAIWRALGGARISSAYRSPQVNAAVGGAGGTCVCSDRGCSNHACGTALDLQPLGAPVGEDKYEWGRKQLRTLPEILGIVESINEGDHLHVALS